VSLKNGTYMNQEFDEMIISCLVRNGVVHIDDISMTKKGESGFNISGIYPYENRKKIMPSISISSNFSNFPLSIINEYFPDFYKIDGTTTGMVNIKGSTKKSNLYYEVEVDNLNFDLIQLGSVSLSGNYKNNSLNIERFYSKSKNGEINSYGSIPYNLNIGSSSLGKFFMNDSFDLTINSKLNNLFLLTPYVPDLDSITGNTELTLELSGNPGEIQRNGKLKVENGRLYSVQLGDVVDEINAEAIINDNILAFDDFKANIYHNNSKYIDKEEPNTTISGEIDLNQFFKPFYNLKIKSDEASYKLLLIDITGQANLDLDIFGRDTIEVSGVIESLDAKVFYEFNQEDIGTAIDQNNNIVMSYNITIPMRSPAFFQNSQIDAEILGEVSLSQKGHQEIDFGGQIIVEDGSVFSYKDNFEGLQGIVNFDNKGFNPFVDVNANTFIDDERISLRITGGIEDLDIILESGSGFSESDILELLTWGKRFEDQEMTSTGFGNQTVSILGALLENQLEKNLKESSLGMMNYVDDIDIKGAAGLLQGAEEDFELTAKRQIGNKTYLNLSYKRSFSLNQDRSQIGVEYKLNRHFSVLGNMDREGNLNLKYRYRYAY
jgi:autotransporter translocation and assembly factor TamB